MRGAGEDDSSIASVTTTTTHIHVSNKVSSTDDGRVYIDEVMHWFCIDNDSTWSCRLKRENFVPKVNIDDIHADFRSPAPNVLRQNSISFTSPPSESPSIAEAGTATAEKQAAGYA